MERAVVDGQGGTDLSSGVEYWPVGEFLGAEEVSVNRYTLAPQTRLPWGIHAHDDQEELFVVTEGTVTFETPTGRIEATAGEAIRFAPGEYQAGRNAHARPAALIAIGAPAPSEDIRIPRPCPSCDANELRIELDSGALACPACAETIPGECQACGADDRSIQLGDDGTALVDHCRSCGDEQPIQPVD